jgi:hypothetical protein
MVNHDIAKLKFRLFAGDFLFFENGDNVISLHILRKCPLELCEWLSGELADFMAIGGAHFFDFYKLDLRKPSSRMGELGCDGKHCLLGEVFDA